jgi:glycerophosphoryl diester phosphodiesterase
MKMSVGVWTPNEPADIRRAIGLGVDMIISDEPLRVMELLKALQRLR